MNVTLEMFTIILAVVIIAIAIRWYLDPDTKNNPNITTKQTRVNKTLAKLKTQEQELQAAKQVIRNQKTARIMDKVDRVRGFLKKHLADEEKE